MKIQSMFVFLSEGVACFPALRPLVPIELLCVFACGITMEDTTQTSMWYYTALRKSTSISVAHSWSDKVKDEPNDRIH
jgi:hypothetical protein